MNFLMRFYLGLPARVQDIEEIKRIIPEIDDIDILSVKRKYRYFYPFYDFDEQFFRDLKEWINLSEYEAPNILNSENCSYQDCPIKNGKLDNASENDIGYLQFLTAGGGPDSKPPKGMFLDLVRKSKKNMGYVKEVILTDPYLYTDISEDGIEGGFSNLVEYLHALNLTKESSFKLKTNPSAKKSTSRTKDLLHNRLKEIFPSINIENYSPKCSFHDRFYIIRDDKGKLGGVFGPSLNGLNSKAIVLMGDIEGMQPLKKLDAWL